MSGFSKFSTVFFFLRYGIHFYDLHYEGVWEKRGTIMYYSDLIMELSALCVDFVHHFHMLVSIGLLIIIILTRCYVALFRPDWHFKALPLLSPVTGPFNSFLKLSHLPGEHTACATNRRFSA